MECISIPECTQRLSHLTTLGGQHGQESEEGEEGEERSEEDCEEDQEGRQEEEVTTAYENAGGFYAGTSQEPSGGFRFLKLNSIRKAQVDEKRVSARHQVKRLDRPLEFAPDRSGRRNWFSSFGADRLVRNFIGPKALSEIWS